VSNFHKEAERHFSQGNHVILIGHHVHPEVEGTMGQLPEGAVLLVETVSDIETLNVSDESKISFCTQTTLSVDDTLEIVEALQARFPNIIAPHREDICYATTNRQAAVKEIAEKCDALMVIGAPNSSNSNRLVEVGLGYGTEKSCLVQRAIDVDLSWLDGVKTLGLTAGASAPEVLVVEVINKIREHYNVTVQEVTITKENVVFNIPRVLRDKKEKAEG
jgi:4-hydroxy-3-methylbut-2-enyl diphosphate reductase